MTILNLISNFALLITKLDVAIFLVLLVLISYSVIKIKAKGKSYTYASGAFILLATIRLIQIVKRPFSAYSLENIIGFIAILILLIFAFILFLYGWKKEGKK